MSAGAGAGGQGASALMARALARVPFVDAWPFAILVWTAAFGIVLRCWRIVDGVWGTDHWRDLWWIPRTVAVDAAFAVIVWLAAGLALSRASTRRARNAMRAAVVTVLLLLLALGCANALSFHISGSALTLQRLRGDDGATLRDAIMIQWADIWPIVALVVVAVASFALALWRASSLERYGRESRAAVAVAVVIAGAGGFALHASLWQARDHGYGRHWLGVLIESAVQELGAARPAELAEFKAPPASDDGWRALLHATQPATPAPPSPERAAPTVKNVVVFFSEGVPLKHTSLAPDGPPTTPRLKARADQAGLVLERFYSPYHRSIHAIYSLFCGEFPPPTPAAITVLNPRIDCDEFSTAFARAGLKPALFHGGYFAFWDKTQFFGDRDYVALEDAAAFGDPKKYQETVWGTDDRVMVQRALEWIDTLAPEDRFALALIPITAHYPYKVPDDVETPFGDSRKIDRFRGAVYFLDVVFDQLMEGLAQRGRLDDTLVMFTADHGESPQEPARVTNVDRAAYEYNVRVPAVFFAPKMFPTAQRTERLASIPDILPTLLDAVGAADSRARQGTSLFAPTERWREKRVWMGASRSNVDLLGFIDGHDKFLLNLANGRMELYDLRLDPDELDNKADRDPRVTRWRDDVLTFADWQLERVKTWPSLDARPDVQELLANDFDVAVVGADGTRVGCTPRAGAAGAAGGGVGARTCPGYGDDVFQGVLPMQLAGAQRRCMLLRAPPGATLELRATARDYFPHLSMVQMLSTTGQVAHGQSVRDALTIDSDGKRIEGRGHGSFRRLAFPPIADELHVTVAPTAEPFCLFFSWRSFEPPDGAAGGHDG